MNEPKAPQAIPSGPERELQIYAQALAGGKLSVPISLCVLEQKAKEILEPRAYDYVAGGAGGEDTMRANREAFYRWRIVPRMLRDVSKRDLSVELLGTRLPTPVLLGPVGVQGIVHAEHDVELFDRRRRASRGKSKRIAALVSTVLGEKSRTHGEHAAARGARRILRAGGDT